MSKQKLENIQSVDIALLNPAPYNPRVDLKPSDVEYQHIKNSIENFGYLDPIVWNKRTGNIVSGHQRFKILKEQGVKEIQCVVVDFDIEKEKACNLAMNKAQGLWDFEKMDALLLELKDSSFDLTDFGFEEVGDFTGFEEKSTSVLGESDTVQITLLFQKEEGEEVNSWLKTHSKDELCALIVEEVRENA